MMLILNCSHISRPHYIFLCVVFQVLWRTVFLR